MCVCVCVCVCVCSAMCSVVACSSYCPLRDSSYVGVIKRLLLCCYVVDDDGCVSIGSLQCEALRRQHAGASIDAAELEVRSLFCSFRCNAPHASCMHVGMCVVAKTGGACACVCACVVYACVCYVCCVWCVYVRVCYVCCVCMCVWMHVFLYLRMYMNTHMRPDNGAKRRSQPHPSWGREGVCARWIRRAAIRRRRARPIRTGLAEKLMALGREQRRLLRRASYVNFVYSSLHPAATLVLPPSSFVRGCTIGHEN